MWEDPAVYTDLPARCMIERLGGLRGNRWVLEPSQSSPAFTCRDLWHVLRTAHERGFNEAVVKYGTVLYLVSFAEWE